MNSQQRVIRQGVLSGVRMRMGFPLHLPPPPLNLPQLYLTPPCFCNSISPPPVSATTSLPLVSSPVPTLSRSQRANRRNKARRRRRREEELYRELQREAEKEIEKAREQERLQLLQRELEKAQERARELEQERQRHGVVIAGVFVGGNLYYNK